MWRKLWIYLTNNSCQLGREHRIPWLLVDGMFKILNVVNVGKGDTLFSNVKTSYYELKRGANYIKLRRHSCRTLNSTSKFQKWLQDTMAEDPASTGAISTLRTKKIERTLLIT